MRSTHPTTATPHKPRWGYTLVIFVYRCCHSLLNHYKHYPKIRALFSSALAGISLSLLTSIAMFFSEPMVLTTLILLSLTQRKPTPLLTKSTQVVMMALFYQVSLYSFTSQVLVVLSPFRMIKNFHSQLFSLFILPFKVNICISSSYHPLFKFKTKIPSINAVGSLLIIAPTIFELASMLLHIPGLSQFALSLRFPIMLAAYACKPLQLVGLYLLNTYIIEHKHTIYQNLTGLKDHIVSTLINTINPSLSALKPVSAALLAPSSTHEQAQATSLNKKSPPPKVPLSPIKP